MQLVSANVRVQGRSSARCGVSLTLYFSLLILMTLGFSSLVQAQSLSGISGTVTDKSGGVVNGARVAVVNNATQVKKTTETSSSGSYMVTDLIPGTYTVTVDIAGFQSSVHNGVGVEVGKNHAPDAARIGAHTNVSGAGKRHSAA